jgi:hypothetical protein
MLRAEDEVEDEGDFRENFSKNVIKCTTEHFKKYLEIVNENLSGTTKFKFEDFKAVILEMDPYNTGFIQLAQVRKFFNEEVAHY